MDFLKAYARNLLLVALLIGFMACFVLYFYPGTVPLFREVGRFYSLLGLWPFIILLILIYALPRRRR